MMKFHPSDFIPQCQGTICGHGAHHIASTRTADWKLGSAFETVYIEQFTGVAYASLEKDFEGWIQLIKKRIDCDTHDIEVSQHWNLELKLFFRNKEELGIIDSAG